MNAGISGIEAVVLDLDGTVYRGDALISGAAMTVEELRDAGLRVLFLTNKAIYRRDEYAEKLTKLGIPAKPADVINSGWVTAEYLTERHPDRLAYVIGEQPLLDELTAAGLTVTSDRPGELLVVSMDRSFTYEKLLLALRTLEDDVPFVATNPDRTCPSEEGEIPGAGGMIGAVEGTSGHSVDTILGKPSTRMVETVMNVLDVDPTECLMVGDRLDTDIKMANRAGMHSVLVRSGVSGTADIEAATVTPDRIVDRLDGLVEILGDPLVSRE